MLKKNEIKITRLFDAPVKVIWDAWTDPKKVEKWWGPRGFTLTTHSKDLKAGGHWDYTMHGPDGTDYPNTTIYHEVEKYKKLVYDHGGHADKPPLFRVTALFKEIKNKTQLEMTMAFPSEEVAKQMIKFIKDAGGTGTWDRLAEFVEKESSDKEVFVIARSFNAPIEKVFTMWTDPKHFSQWLGPTGSTLEFIDSKIAEGKTTFYKMSYDTGLVMFGKMTYAKIESPKYIEYTQIFCDEKGQLSKHPNVPLWPSSMLTKVFFSQEDDDQTRVTVIWEPAGNFSRDELQEFINMRAGMTQGWTQSFDKLETCLA